MEQEQAVLFEIDGSVAVITLNRPKRRNAMNQALLAQLYEGTSRELRWNFGVELRNFGDVVDYLDFST